MKTKNTKKLKVLKIKNKILKYKNIVYKLHWKK
jgi:hypothetical protein